MSSFNNPKVTNSINSDISEIRELLQILAKQDYTGVDDTPTGAKRIASVTGGVQFQNFSGNSWSGIGKLMHDVDQLDGYHASTSAVKNTIPVYNANARLVGDITGNASTATKLQTKKTIDIGGIVTADATEFDGSDNVTIPVNSINVNNEDDTALIGIVSKAHGGTGRDDGAATDVIVSSLVGDVKASDYGQIGDAKLVSGVDLNTLVVSGNYIASSAAGSYDLNYPSIQSGWTLIRVDRYSNIVKQTIYQGAYLIWVRYSDDSGASWKAWQPIGGSFYNSYSIYISKSGSDTNTGLDKEHPVLTINRAMHIAATLLPIQNSPYINFYVGDGDWGDVTFTCLPYRLRLRPYSGEANEYSDSLPKFGTLSSLNSHVTLYGVNANILDANECGFLSIISYNRCAMIRARNDGIVYIADSNNPVEIKSTNSHSFVFSSYSNGFISINSARTINIVENLNLSDGGGVVSISNGRIFGLSKLTFSVADGVSVIGKKYRLAGCADVDASKSFLDTLPGSENGIIRSGVSINGIPYGGGDTHTFLAADGTFKKDSDSIYAKDIAIDGDASDLASASGLLGKCVYVSNTSNPDFDIDTQVFDTALVYVSNNSHGTPPTGVTGWCIVVQYNGNRTSTGSRIQILYNVAYGGFQPGRAYIRYYWSSLGGWTDWNPFLTAAQVGDGITVNNGIISVPEYEGATASKAGTSGLVPSATNAETESALCGDGTYRAFLQLDGGTMTGAINRNGVLAQLPTSTSQYLAILGSTTSQKGSGLYLYSDASSQNGLVILRARGTDQVIHDLRLQSDGVASWDGKNIVRSINGVSADVNGNVTIEDSGIAPYSSEVTLNDNIQIVSRYGANGSYTFTKNFAGSLHFSGKSNGINQGAKLLLNDKIFMNVSLGNGDSFSKNLSFFYVRTGDVLKYTTNSAATSISLYLNGQQW